MFAIQNDLTDLKVKDRNIYKILYSMNNHPVATPEMSVEEARCYILFFSEGPDLSAFIGLYLPRTDRKFFYAYSSNPFPMEGQGDVEDEARNFAENMGFLLDEINVGGMAAEDRNHWIEEQYIFGYKKPEMMEEASATAEESKEEAEQPEPEKQEKKEPAAKAEPAVPERNPEAVAPPAPVAAPTPVQAPAPAAPVVQQPVSPAPVQQPEPAQQQPYQPQYQQPAPQPGQPYGQPPAAPQYPHQPPQQPYQPQYQQPVPQPGEPSGPPQAPHYQQPIQTQYQPVPHRPQYQQPVPQPGQPSGQPPETPPYQQSPVPELGEPIVPPAPVQQPRAAQRPAQQRPQPAPQPKAAATKKSPVQKTAKRTEAEEEAHEERVPDHPAAEETVVTRQNVLEAAFTEQVIKRPKPKAPRAAISATGTVTRDKEALARLLASF